MNSEIKECERINGSVKQLVDSLNKDFIDYSWKAADENDGETNENGSGKGWGRSCWKDFGNNLSFQGYVILAFLSLNHVISITSLLVDYNIFLFAVKFSMFVLRNTQNWPFVIIKLKKAMRNFLLNSRPYLQERWWYNRVFV